MERLPKLREKVKANSEMKSDAFPIKIGLEIHGYLDTKEKLFCKCKANQDSAEKANSQVCPICTGQPGCKPMLPNGEAMKKLLQIALVLGCKVNSDKKILWQRKHYSWPDMPKGFQSTMSGSYSVPCAENGDFYGIKIREVHLEEDPARWNPDSGNVDYDRSGLPLVEIVTEPDFRSAEEVVAWLKNLIHALSYIKAVKKNAGIKADVNVSTYGDRAEIKNLNSIENMKHAIEYETQRQLENAERGITQKRETLAYDEAKGITVKMRDKEGAEDYRFIPEPDLPVVKIAEKEVAALKRQLPEMPDIKLEKLLKKFKVDRYNAEVLTKNLELVDFFETLAKLVDAKKYISWITIELLRVLNYNRKTLADVDIRPEHVAELIQAVDKKKITELKAKQVMNEFVPKSFSIKNVEGIGKLPAKDVEAFCVQAIKENESAVKDFKAGKQEALNFLVGQVMKLSKKRADFMTATKYLLTLLK